MNRRTRNIICTACRLVLALTFIFSGAVKSMDPWGTAMKIEEYLSIYGFEELSGASMVFSVWLCGAEMMMGLMLLFGVRIRLVSTIAFVSMLFFTVLTLLSATVIPVEDCGCFGDAVKLTPWQTFAKNAVLLPMSFVVMWCNRHGRMFCFNMREVLLAALFFAVSIGLGCYSYLHLPPIDFLPYKVGVNIGAEMERAAAEDASRDVRTVLVYRNISTGKLHEFALEDEEWRDSSLWEWADTYTTGDEHSMRPTVAEFAVRDVEGDATGEILSVQGRLYMFCTDDASALDGPCRSRLEHMAARAAAEGAQVICLTSKPLHDVTYISAGGLDIRCYNVDASTLKTMLRARSGVVVLDDGTITDKRNCRDM